MSMQPSILWFEDEPDNIAIPLAMVLKKNFHFCRAPWSNGGLNHSISSGILYLLEVAFGEPGRYDIPDLILLDAKLTHDPHRNSLKPRIESFCSGNGILAKDIEECFSEQHGGAVLKLLGHHFAKRLPGIKVVYLSQFGEDTIKKDLGGSVLQDFPGILAGYYWKNEGRDAIVAGLHEILGDEKRGLSFAEIRSGLKPSDADFLLGGEGEGYEWSEAYRRALTDLVRAGEDKAWPYSGKGPKRPGEPHFVPSADPEFRSILSSHKRLPRALILAARGCGKEGFSGALHRMWYRDFSQAPFSVINIGGVPPWSAGIALQIRLFGGHQSDRQPISFGCVPSAWNGTLLMDELGDAKKDVQDTLLRLIQEGEYEAALWRPDVWAAHCAFIGATNRDPWSGEFRPDVADRLALHIIKIPSLCEVVSDIPIWMRKIARSLAEKHNSVHNDKVPAEFEFEEVAGNILQGYSWPGNLRELSHAIRRMQIRSMGQRKVSLAVVGSEVSRMVGKQVIASGGGVSLPVTIMQREQFISDVAAYVRQAGKKTLAKGDVVKYLQMQSSRETLNIYQVRSHFEGHFGFGGFDAVLRDIAVIAGIPQWGGGDQDVRRVE